MQARLASGNAPLVRAALAEAGLSQDAIDHALKQYPYMRWDVEQKVLPAMQQQQQELGARFPSALRNIPSLLLRSTKLAKARTQAASDNAMRVKIPLRRLISHKMPLLTY